MEKLLAIPIASRLYSQLRLPLRLSIQPARINCLRILIYAEPANGSGFVPRKPLRHSAAGVFAAMNNSDAGEMR
jgi:hypothetical protein